MLLVSSGICLLQTVLVALPSIAGGAAGSPPKFIQIPVLYLTDRELKGESFGPQRRYPSFCQHHMYYGTTMVTVKNTLNKDDPQLFARLGWKPAEQKGAKVAPKDRINPADPEASKVAFFDRLQKVVRQSGNNKVCIFAHGSIDPFEDASDDAAELAYHLQMPLIMYSWPAGSRFRGYFLDGNNCEWSQAHFENFWRDMIAFNSKMPLEVTAVAHSMGNRLLVRALPVVYGKPFVKNWVLVSPDMDADTCRHYAMGLEPNGSKIRLYVSNRDKLLPVAQILAGGYYRLGEAARPVQLPENWQKTDGAFERIDFTEDDRGFEGHTIPSELIANVIKDNTAGAGFELVPESEVRAGRLARFANRRRRLSNTAKDLPEDMCKRVLKLAAPRSQKSAVRGPSGAKNKAGAMDPVGGKDNASASDSRAKKESTVKDQAPAAK